MQFIPRHHAHIIYKMLTKRTLHLRCLCKNHSYFQNNPQALQYIVSFHHYPQQMILSILSHYPCYLVNPNFNIISEIPIHVEFYLPSYEGKAAQIMVVQENWNHIHQNQVKKIKGHDLTIAITIYLKSCQTT